MALEKHNKCPNRLHFWFRSGKVIRDNHGKLAVSCVYSVQFNESGYHPFTAEYVRASTDIGLCEDCARELGLIW